MARKNRRPKALPQGADSRLPPVAPPPPVASARLAPWPLVDRYPLVIGSNITLQYVSSVLRLCTTGYRREYVDLLDELLERDGHTSSLLGDRYQAVGQGRLELTPAELPPGHPDEAQALAIAQDCAFLLRQIPDLQQSLTALAWGGFYGVSGAEISWDLDWVPIAKVAGSGEVYGQRWRPTRLHLIHSRRLAYPDPQTWEAHVWDQGQVRSWTDGGFGKEPTAAGNFGLSLRDYEGKFILHTPQYRGDYPTREGLSRPLVWLMSFKVMGLRQNAQFVERFAKLWVYGSYSTQNDGKPKAADDPEIEKGEAVIKALGLGSLSSGMVADCIQIHVDGPAMKGQEGVKMLPAWIELVNDESTKIIRGSTFTTSPGKYGTKGTADSGKDTEGKGERYDAQMLAETIRRDLVTHMVRLNHPQHTHLVPRVALHLDRPDPASRLELASNAADKGVPVDARRLGEEIGLPLLAPDDEKGERMAPLAPVQLLQLIQGAAALATGQPDAGDPKDEKKPPEKTDDPKDEKKDPPP